MKKILSLVLALVMVLCAVCAVSAENVEIEDTMTSADGTYEVAFITDIGQLKDKSFNESTWNGVKAYAFENGLSYKYYQPANGDAATDDDRYDAMKAAVDAGAKVVVCAGYMHAGALSRIAAEHPEVPFIFIDGDPNGLDNVAGIAFCEEQCGYLAGYAVVSEGYTRLGFTGGGGGTNPACCRYGYGFAQGANDAAAAKGITVDLKYSWQNGASFSASPELQTQISGWYETGSEVVFVCGGPMFQSVVAAASANDGSVVGVDVDQSFESETVITSAMKGLASATKLALSKVYDGSFAELGGKGTSLGLAEDAVGLPTETWSLANFSVDDYNALCAKILDGSVAIDNSVLEADAITGAALANVNVDYE